MFTLHAHSVYSLLEGAIKPNDLIAFAQKYESGYAAITDTNGMYGAIQFAKKAEEEGIKPILGAYIDDPETEEHYAVFVARNNDGYAHLNKIITSRKLDEDFRLVDIFLSDLSNLYVLTSSIELLKIISLTDNLRKTLRAELVITEEKKHHSRDLYNFAKENKIPVVATHPAYFKEPDDFLLHQVVTAIRENSTLANLDKSLLVDEEYCLKPPKELEEMWKALPEAIWNADKIAQDCNVDLQFGKYKFPTYPLPYGETAFSYLWKVCFRGLEEKYHPITEQAVKRLQYELQVIDELGFCDYFLVVWDIVNEARKRGMMTIGRGSAANSLVSYCLDFTQVDPIEQNLYFERFMNRGRTSPPDVDLDFSWRERDEIVKYIYDKYGYEKVAMISTTVTFRARSAFRETAKVFGIPNEEISKYSKYIPWTSAENLPVLAEKFPESKSLSFDDEPWRSIIKIATQLAGFPRHLSIHPGGIVITDSPITDYVALEYAKNKGLGLIITQPDMYPIEDFGLIKIDLLSQRSLGVLRDTMKKLTKDVPAEARVVSGAKIFSIRPDNNKRERKEN
ncbi:MAG: hypothetical protein SCALA702_24980 [Melioribacteraceae bacterium]|nr:MAG: hypothetical protein SCALA702_24980 [Melioribacteraceae bacterium]